jgi:hypothetical protein
MKLGVDSFRGKRFVLVVRGLWFRAGWIGPSAAGCSLRFRRWADRSGASILWFGWSRFPRHCWHLSFGPSRFQLGFSGGRMSVTGGPFARWVFGR